MNGSLSCARNLPLCRSRRRGSGRRRRERAVRQENGGHEQAPATSDGRVAGQDGGELRQAFINARLIGAPLRRVRSLNRLYSIGEPNDHVQGWREVYVSGDEPFALDFGMVRVELGFHSGGSLRMMDGRLPDEVLEADAVYPRDLSAVFSSVIGQRLADVSSSRIWNEGREHEQLCLRFANGCTLNFCARRRMGRAVAHDVQTARSGHVRSRSGLAARSGRQDQKRSALAPSASLFPAEPKRMKRGRGLLRPAFFR